VTDEQRSEAGCVGGQNGALISGWALSSMGRRRPQGWEGWDEYAPFYDWENARTLGRRDVPFWRRLATAADGLVLELGCGTGRIFAPLARTGARLVGIDRSGAMLARLRPKLAGSLTRGKVRASRVDLEGARSGLARPLIRGDIRALPFSAGTFSSVFAPYGVLQSLLVDADLTACLCSVARVLKRDGLFALDLVADVPKWREYSNRVQLRGRAGRGVHFTLIESVRQDRVRQRTTFAQRYIERRAGRAKEHRFELTFRTLSVPRMSERLEAAGFLVDRVLGDYRGRPWDERADAWIILAKKR
jgi:SAM-dependent methyltransferase